MSDDKFSEDAERAYYSKAGEDRRALPYSFLDAYIAGSVGRDFFRNKRVLDIGSGEGVYSAWIADPKCGRATSVVGIELTEHRIRRDYEKLLPNLSFLSENVLNISPIVNGYDIVFMNLVLHHLRFCLDDVIDFIYRSIPSGGQFFAMEPNTYSPVALLLHMIHNKSANEGFLAPWRVRKTLEKRGFKKVEIGYCWRDRYWAQNPVLASCFYVVATK